MALLDIENLIALRFSSGLRCRLYDSSIYSLDKLESANNHVDDENMNKHDVIYEILYQVCGGNTNIPSIYNTIFAC